MVDHSQSVLSSVKNIAYEFAIAGTFSSGAEIDCGLINTTFLAIFDKPDGRKKRYLFQRINNTVFKEPVKVMQNIERVTRHINWKVMRVKRSMGGQTLNLYPARGGNYYIEGQNGGLWRCYNYIEGCISYDECTSEKIAYEASHAFGAFLDLVSDFPPEELHETIPDFHHTIKRYARLMEVVKADPHGRVLNVEAEIDFIKQRELDCHRLIDLLESKKLPLRVTHNDTKINNVMIDTEVKEAVCVIDLDTVMPGLSAYDFGDLVRTAVSVHAEDTTDLSQVKVRPSYFEALLKGYTDGSQALTEEEIINLPYGGVIMALEVGIRFLTDYLEGDVYFKTTHPNHNLDRCRTQLKLVEQLQAHEEEFTKLTHSIIAARKSK